MKKFSIDSIEEMLELLILEAPLEYPDTVFIKEYKNKIIQALKDGKSINDLYSIDYPKE
jgi:hypothetical protein